MDYMDLLADAFEVDGLDAQRRLEALQVLHKQAEAEDFKLPKNYFTHIRLKGYCSSLLDLCLSASPPVRRAALVVMRAGARVDIHFNAQLLKEGVVRKLLPVVRQSTMAMRIRAKGCQPEQQAQETADVDGLHNMGIVFRILGRVALPEVPSANPKETLDALFRHGYVALAARILDNQGCDVFLLESVLGLVGAVSMWKAYRERISDLGLIPRLVQLVGSSLGAVYILCNLSRTHALHSMLRDAGLLEAMQAFAHSAQEAHTDESADLAKALIAVANVYGSDARQDSVAGKLLSTYDVSLPVVSMLDAVLHGDRSWNDMMFTLDEAAHAARALSSSPWLAQRMLKAGAVDMLVELLMEGGDDDAIMHTCLAMLNLTQNLPHLHATLIKAGVPDAVRLHIEHPDARVVDAVRGVLLHLHALNDSAAQEALDSGLSDNQQVYDVFLSHKRSDAKDFARALYNLLVLRGITTFLDYEYHEELQLNGGLAQLVSNCRNFIFVLTDHALESEWCLQELQSAADHGKNIILVVKEGSRWPDLEGAKTTPFPGSHLLTGLSPKLRSVFTRKAVHHSDEYYQAFVGMLLKKLAPSQPPSLPPPRVPVSNAYPRSVSLPNIGPFEDELSHAAAQAAPARHSLPAVTPSAAAAAAATQQLPGLPPALVPAPAPAGNSCSLPPLTPSAPASQPLPLLPQHGLPPQSSLGARASAPCLHEPTACGISSSSQPGGDSGMVGMAAEGDCLTQDLRRELYALQAEVQHMRAEQQRQREHALLQQHAVQMLQFQASLCPPPFQVSSPHQHLRPPHFAHATALPLGAPAGMVYAAPGNAMHNPVLPPLQRNQPHHSHPHHNHPDAIPRISEAGAPLNMGGHLQHPCTVPGTCSEAGLLHGDGSAPQQLAVTVEYSNATAALGNDISRRMRDDAQLPRWLKGTALPPVKAGMQSEPRRPWRHV